MSYTYYGPMSRIKARTDQSNEKKSESEFKIVSVEFNAG